MAYLSSNSLDFGCSRERAWGLEEENAIKKQPLGPVWLLTKLGAVSLEVVPGGRNTARI